MKSSSEPADQERLPADDGAPTPHSADSTRIRPVEPESGSPAYPRRGRLDRCPLSFRFSPTFSRFCKLAMCGSKEMRPIRPPSNSSQSNPSSASRRVPGRCPTRKPGVGSAKLRRSPPNVVRSGNEFSLRPQRKQGTSTETEAGLVDSRAARFRRPRSAQEARAFPAAESGPRLSRRLRPQQSLDRATANLPHKEISALPTPPPKPP